MSKVSNHHEDDQPSLDLRRAADRRTYLKLLGIGGAAGLAGCAGDDEQNQGDGSGDQGDSGGGNESDTTESTTAEEIKQGGHLRVAFPEGPQNLSPFEGITTTDYALKETMYSRLTQVNSDFEVVPDVATEWKANDDATQWTFMLREGVKFPNGDELLAEDVYATVQALREKVPNGKRDLYDIKNAEVEDDYRIRFDLSAADAQLPKRLTETGTTFNIAPASVLKDDYKRFESKDLGTGPMTLVEFESGDFWRFKANENYFLKDENGNQLPYVDELTVVGIGDPIPRVSALEDTRVDALQTLPPRMLPRVEGIDGAKSASATSARFINVVLNTDLKPFRDNRVRQAIKYATNFKDMLVAIDKRGQVGNQAPVAPMHEFYAENLEDPFGMEAKPDKAKALLEEAGYGGGFELPNLIYDKQATPEKEPQAQLFQQQMANIGIKFDLELVTSDTWLSEYWNKDDVWYISNWATRIEDTTTMRLGMHSESSWNSARWKNEEFDKALENALAAPDVEERRKLLRKAQQIAHLEGAWVITTFLDLFGARNDYIKNYRFFPAIGRDYLTKNVWLGQNAPHPPQG